MIRFFTFLLISLIFSVDLAAQNLIPDPSAEDYYQCPNSLGPVDAFLSQWIAYRGTSDYFHSCCQQPGLCWNNSLGYQEPRSGEGYIGAVLHSNVQDNVREYFGAGLSEPLDIGETYYISFFASWAYGALADNYSACNNLGVLLMTDNYLVDDEFGEVINYCTFKSDDILTDTTNWVRFSATVLADSAYTQIAFGNFFDDANTVYTLPYDEDRNSVTYYYFDDFCVSKDSIDCQGIVSVHEDENCSVRIFPNPTKSDLFIESKCSIEKVELFSVTGILEESMDSHGETSVSLTLESLSSGAYIALIHTNQGISKKRIMVQ